MNKGSITLLLSALLTASACGEAETLNDGEVRSAQAAGPAKLVELDEPVPQPEVELATQASVATPDSVEGILAAAAQVESARPDFYAELNGARIGKSPNGMARFTHLQLADADAGVVLAARMLNPELTVDERNALADALARTGGDFGALTAALFGQEQDAKVRSTMAMTLRRASSESARVGLVLAIADADAQVRADAAHAAASHPELEALRAPLRNALNDASSVTRAAAARALGVLQDGESAATILTMINDEDAETRLQALRALKRIDTGLLAQVNLTALEKDADPRIAKEAAKLGRAAQ